MDKFVIHCVFDGEKGMGDFSDMCSFCLREGIPCVIRPFSHAHEEDKDEIVRLPAYHVFYRGDYELTFYPGDCPAATLEEVREKSKKRWSLLDILGWNKGKRMKMKAF
jgi:hypothetical protein